MPQSLSQVWLHIVFSTKDRQTFQVIEYAEQQVEKHERRSYQDEFRELCNKHEIEIDERYVWD